MKDVLPELLEKVEKEFEREFEKSKTVLQVLEKVKNRQATYKEANKLAVELGEILSKSFEHNISAGVLPDGKMYYNIAQRLLNKTLGNNHDIISKTCANIQTDLNKSAKINIKGIVPELNQNRIDGLIEKVVKADNYDDVSWVLGEPIVNFSQSIVNDSIKVNSDFHYKLGLKAKIIRQSTGHCCDWCNKLVGVYEYPDVPKDVYRVHQRCRCTVDYYPGDGKKQNVHSKKWINKEAEEKRHKITKNQKQGISLPRVLKKDDIDTKNFAKGSGKNYPIRYIKQDHVKFAAESIKKVTVIAGYKVKTKIREAARLESFYSQPKKRWQKLSGETEIYYKNKRKKIEIHWYEANGRKYEAKVKRVIDDES